MLDHGEQRSCTGGQAESLRRGRVRLDAGGVPPERRHQRPDRARGGVDRGLSCLRGEVLRFGLGYGTPSRSFEDCREVPYVPNAVYLLASEQTPGAGALQAAGAPLLARIPRPGGDAYRVYGSPTLPSALQVQPDAGNPICQERSVWDASA